MTQSHDWSLHLHDGERILWQGRPATRLFVFRAYDIFIIPFSVLFLAISLAALFFGALVDVMMLISASIFTVISLYLALGRFYVSRARRHCTRYALTNTRALITQSETLTQMPLTPDLPIRLRKDRVTFGKPVIAFSNQSSVAAILGRDADFTFCGLGDAAAVFDIAEQAKQPETP